MGTSGKYGPNTRDMVKFLKSGFGLKDKSGDITKELVDEIQIQRGSIKESISSRIYDFSSFVNISEAAFNLAAGLEVAKTLPTYKSGKITGKTASKEDEKSPYGWKPASYKEGSTGSIVKAIQNILGVGDSSSGTFDKQTTDRVIEFQKLNDLEDDGIVGKKTLEAIYGTRDSAKTHKLLDKTRRGPWSYETIGKEISQVYSKPAGGNKETVSTEPEKPKEVEIDQKKVDEIAQAIYDGAEGKGTEEEDIKDAILKIKTLDEFKSVEKKLGDLFVDSGEPRADKPIKTVINNEFGKDEFDEVKSIVSHLKNVIKINSEFKSTEDLIFGTKLFIEDSFNYTY